MKEEKENMILKFLGFFVGPIQFVMEVSSSRPRKHDVPSALVLKRNVSAHLRLGLLC